MRRPRHATLVAYLALFFALSTGGAYAAATIGASSIKNNAIRSRHIQAGQVRTVDLHDNAVKTQKLQDNAVTGPKVDESTLSQVPDSAALQGRIPSSFLASTVYKKESPLSAGTRLGDNTNALGVSCDAGDVLLSGGPANVSATSKLLESFPSPGTTNGWSARINDNGTPDKFSVVILCVDQTP